MGKDYEVCFTNGDVCFMVDGVFNIGTLIGVHPVSNKELIVYIANCFYITEIEDAKLELKRRLDA